jgi:REP element-mobilizing transposase RayT
MNSEPAKPGRRSIRLPHWDYSSEGAYFITVCVQGHRCLLGKIIEEKMRLSEFGAIAEKWWGWLGDHYDHVQTDSFVVMPNHIHGILVIRNRRGGSRTAPT